MFVLVLLHPGLSISPLEWLSRSRSKPPDVGAMLQQLFTTTVSLCGIVHLSASRHQNVLLMHIESCRSHWEEKHGFPACHTTGYPRGRIDIVRVVHHVMHEARCHITHSVHSVTPYPSRF